MPTAPARQAQLTALADLLDEAVRAQPAADRAIAACGEPGAVPAAALFEAGRQDSVFYGLLVRLRGLPVDQELTGLQERASRLLGCHFWLVHEAVNLVCALQRGDRAEAARLRLHGLGALAAELRVLRDEVRAAAECAGPGEAAASGERDGRRGGQAARGHGDGDRAGTHGGQRAGRQVEHGQRP